MASRSITARIVRRFQANRLFGNAQINPQDADKSYFASIPILDEEGVERDFEAPLVATIPYDTNLVSSQQDSFGRSRVALPDTLFDSKLLYDAQPLFWTQATPAGTAATHSANRASMTLSINAEITGTVVHQTRQRFNYQSGKSMLINMTGVIGPNIAGVTKQWGYFDDHNGLYFQMDEDGIISVGQRSYVSGAVVNTEYTQALWNLDTLDGHGLSGEILDLTKAQIFVIDFEWLGTGIVRFGIDLDGEILYFHKIHHANLITSVYMSTPNLPIRYEMSGNGANEAATLEAICATVISEGGSPSLGGSFSADRHLTVITASAGNGQNALPILSLRLNSNHPGVTIELDVIEIVSPTDGDFHWELRFNPTIAGTDHVSWQTLTGSAVEYDVSRDPTNLVSGGVLLASGYSTNTNNAGGKINLQKRIRPTLGFSAAGVADQIVLVGYGLATAAISYLGGIS